MRKYNFMGKDTSEKEFWMLCALTSIEKIDQAINGDINQEKIKKVLSNFKTTQQKELGTPKYDSCKSQMKLNNTKWENIGTVQTSHSTFQ